MVFRQPKVASLHIMTRNYLINLKKHFDRRVLLKRAQQKTAILSMIAREAGRIVSQTGVTLPASQIYKYGKNKTTVMQAACLVLAQAIIRRESQI